MKKTQKRHALLMSALSLLLCVSMLVGTTFAWFTDEVTSGMNTIAAGNLDIELLADGVKVESGTKLFSEVEKWEPGVVVYENLQIANVGTLALKYQMSLNFGKENTLNGHKLSEVLQIAVVDKIAQGADRAAVLASVQNATSLEDFSIAGSLTAGAKTEEKAVVIFWAPGENDNWYNANNGQLTSDEMPLSIEFGVKLLATQLMSEDDSFGTDYDKDAWVDGFDVFNAQDLQAAINNGETAIDLMADIEAAESIVIPEGATVALNLKGKTLTGTMHKNDGAVISNKGNLTITGGTVKSTAPNGGSALQNAGTANVENATLNGASNADGSWPSYAVNNTGKLTLTNTNITSVHGGVASYGNDAVVTMNNTNLDMSGIPGFTSHGLYTYNNGQIVVNGGNIANNAADQNATGASVINGTVTVNAGTFTGRIENYYGTPVIKGGTFTVNPTSRVAAGYKAVERNGKYFVISDSIAEENVVATPAQLKNALTEAADANSGDNTLYLTGDVDLSGSDWTPISIDGYHGAGVITIEGNGATIKGLNAPLFAGGFAGKSGIVIKDLTIADSNIVCTSGLGGGAFVDSSDSMHVITLENCHLVNSTVSGERAGGLIGWYSGYAKLNDGPVKAYVTISDCSVIDSKVIGNGSAGAIAGHPGASDYTYTTIEDCEVKNVEVVSKDEGSWRTGAIVGTANNGHIVINNVTVENVTLTQNGVTADETVLYGRFVPAGTGTLVIDGIAIS